MPALSLAASLEAVLWVRGLSAELFDILERAVILGTNAFYSVLVRGTVERAFTAEGMGAPQGTSHEEHQNPSRLPGT